MNIIQIIGITKLAILVTLFTPILASAVKPLTEDLFSAIDGLESLIQTKQEVMLELQSVIQEKEHRIEELQRDYSRFIEEQEKLNENAHKYLGNPLNAFTLIKRLTKDLEEIDKIVNASIDNLKDVQLWKPHLIYPSQEDLSGAAIALARLVDTYNLHLNDSKTEKMLKTQFRLLTAEDCYIIADSLYNEENYLSSAKIMTEALKKFQAGDNNNKFTEIDMMKKIEFSFYQEGQTEEAKQWLLKLLKLEPINTEYKSSLNHYNRILEAKEQLKDPKKNFTENGLNVSNASLESIWPSEEYERWKITCQEDIVELPAYVTKNLTCKYTDKNKPHLKITPFKEELLYHDPEIFLYHDVITDEEIKILQNLARKQLARARVIHGNESVKAAYRISKSAWLDDNVDPKVAEISRRMADLTGLTMETAEPFQVGNYGIGGHYAAHHDYVYTHHNGDVLKEYGDRIATLMLYMSEVESGGSTVFPDLGVTVRPEKGAAILWRNLHSSGEADTRTLHGACPVLIGSKWVANKWINQVGQELLSPCPLHRYDTNKTADLPIPVKKQRFCE